MYPLGVYCRRKSRKQECRPRDKQQESARIAAETEDMALFRPWTKTAARENIRAGEITVRVVGTTSEPTVSVAGHVTVDSSPHLRAVLLRLLRTGSSRAITIDLSQVSYLDTSGIATLMEALKTGRDRSINLRLTGVSGQVRMLAEVTELDRIFSASGSEVVLS